MFNFAKKIVMDDLRGYLDALVAKNNTEAFINYATERVERGAL